MKKSSPVFTVFALLSILAISSALPTQFDLRSIPKLSLFANYGVKSEGICLGQQWAQNLAQSLSNMQSIAEGLRLKLSGQNLLECTETVQDKCHVSSLEMIHAGLDYINNKGITAQFCYPNRPLELPKDTCQRQCINGHDFPFKIRAKVEKLSMDSREQILQRLGDGKTSLIAVLLVTDGMNYYHPGALESWEISEDLDQEFGYTVAEIVGWKLGGKQFVMRVGMGAEWGYSGYAHIDVEKFPRIVEEVYALRSVGYSQRTPFEETFVKMD